MVSETIEIIHIDKLVLWPKTITQSINLSYDSDTKMAYGYTTTDILLILACFLEFVSVMIHCITTRFRLERPIQAVVSGLKCISFIKTVMI